MVIGGDDVSTERSLTPKEGCSIDVFYVKENVGARVYEVLDAKSPFAYFLKSDDVLDVEAWMLSSLISSYKDILKGFLCRFVMGES